MDQVAALVKWIFMFNDAVDRVESMAEVVAR